MCEAWPAPKLKIFWSRAETCWPEQHIESHRMFKVFRPFRVSYLGPRYPEPDMWKLMSWQYDRIWRWEVNHYLLKRKESGKRKVYKQDVNYHKRRLEGHRAKLAKLLGDGADEGKGEIRIDNKWEGGPPKAEPRKTKKARGT